MLQRGERVAGTKVPESVLVVIHTPDLRVLLLERADHPGCRREVLEETGIDAAAHELTDWQQVNRYEIYAHWRHRYPEGVTHNTEHVFGLRVPEALPVTIAPREHLRYEWLPWEQAAERCFSWSNAEAIRQLPARAGRAASR